MQNLGLKATPLEDDDDLQDAVLSVHHCYALTLSNTGAVKIIENHLGKAYVRIFGQVVLQQQGGGPPPASPPTIVPGPSSPRPPNRADRRRAGRNR